MSESEKEFLRNNLNKLIPKHLFKELLLSLAGIEIMPVNYESQAFFQKTTSIHSEVNLNTFHYIVFDLTTKHIMILPFSFIDGSLPENRFDFLFPDGHRYTKFTLNSFCYCYISSSVVSNKNSDKAFLTSKKTWVYGDIMIGSCPTMSDNKLCGLTFDKVLDILSTLELSNNYEYFVFYPPC